MKTEWTHTLPPTGLPLEIFDQYGQVRRGVSDGLYIHLSDCTHPMQNAIYPHAKVLAWRADDTSERVETGVAKLWNAFYQGSMGQTNSYGLGSISHVAAQIFPSYYLDANNEGR